MRIIPREEWGAQPTRGTLEPLKGPVKHVIVFPETDTSMCHTPKQCAARCKEIQETHFQKGRPDLMFNFLIGFDCNVYEGTGWNKHGTKIRAHPELTNDVITIAHIGDFEDWTPPWGMLKALEELIKYGVEHNFITADHRRGDVVWGTDHEDPLRFHDKCVPNKGKEERSKSKIATNQNETIELSIENLDNQTIRKKVSTR